MKNLKISKHTISKKHKPYIIVEACVNHQGDFNIAKKNDYFSQKSRSSMHKVSTPYC